MLKISEAKSGGYAVTLCLEGRIIGPWIAELRRACEQILDHGRPLTLRLADVEFMEAEGVVLLIALRCRGVSITDSPPFIAEQLKTVPEVEPRAQDGKLIGEPR